MATTSPRLTRSQGLWLLGTAVATVGPHLPDLPPWLAGLVGALLIAQGLRCWRERPPPPRWLVAVIALGAVAGVIATFHQIFGKDPGVALLTLLLILKLLEGYRHRDARAAVLLAFFLQVALFLNTQSLGIGAWAMVACGFALTSLVSLHQMAGPGSQSRLAGLLLLQGLPFMLVLFVLFPRVQGPLWGQPEDEGRATTGLSDTMRPGDISQLIQSGEIAFRAQFEGAPPPPNQRYWRGPVLTQFDGRTWRASPEEIVTTPDIDLRGPARPYQLTLEPHHKTWLLALDFPSPGISGVRYTQDFRLLALQPVHTRQRFPLTAYPASTVGLAEAPEARQRALKLPPTGNPNARALGHQLRAENKDDSAVVAAALRHFRNLGLTYTLSPPTLAKNPVDGFLLDTRQGFCEHFASSFTFVLRAAGIPTRVVTGYQGGEINPVDGTLVVRQSDAHAWTEAWLAGQGWVRLDPTALAAPARAEGNLAQALGAGASVPFMLRADLQWLRSLRYRWDALNNAWNQWVLGYSQERQREVLRNLGLGDMDWPHLASLLTFFCALLVAALIGWAVWGGRPRDPLERCWLAFCHRLARAGLPRLPWEGPLAYGERAATRFPRHAHVLRQIAQTYAARRYGAQPRPDGLQALRHQVRTLKLT